MRELFTQSEVIDALGGNSPVAALCSTPDEPCSDKAVSNWRRNGFPAKTYLVLQSALLKIGCRAPDHLWNIITVGVSTMNTGAAA